MKKQFISQLEDKDVSFSDNQYQFEQLKKNNPEIFEKFNKEFVRNINNKKVYWQLGYFKECIDNLKLKYNFSTELIEHIIEVKKYIQEKSYSNYSINVNQEFINKKAHQFDFKFNTELSNFKPNETLSKLLEEQDLKKVRDYLIFILNNLRLDLKNIAKEIHYVWQNKKAVFEEDEQSAFVQPMDNNESNWNSDYFNLQQVYLNRNFSLERLFHLLNVRDALMQRGDPNFQPIDAKKATNEFAESSAKIKEEKQTNATRDKDEAYKRSPPQAPDNEFMKIALRVGGAILVVILGVATFFWIKE